MDGETHRSRPTGTVAFLFTDVEGSTRLWEQHADVMRRALARHDRILRGAIDAHDGFVFSTAGDAFSAAFHTPGDAVAAAVLAQRDLQAEAWPDGAEIRVRMGVHLGTAHERDGDYSGTAVNRAARLMGLAHGGQALVSLVVEEAVRDDLTGDVGLVALGEHELRGLTRLESVFQLSVDGLAHEFPPLAAPTAMLGNLPSPPTSFVGRVDDLKRVCAELPTRRFLTLVGPGGMGKTRLAIEAAAAAADEFPDGVWFVDLSPVAEPEAAVHAVASTLSLPPQPGVTLLESIVEALTGRRLLLVLDNCEHVIEAAAQIAVGVGRGTPGVSILATSREPLGLAGEQVWPLAPLDATFEGVELFVERSRSADPSFVVSDEDRSVLAALCARLDGMPLAIELAAARVRSMTLRDLAERLDDRFRLLRGSRRSGVDPRQQTLLATVEWSYQLLDPDEQLLFDRLSVFAGSFDLEAAQAVCSDMQIDDEDIAYLLDELVDRSMIQADRSSSGARFRLLETMRQYGPRPARRAR